MSGDRVVRTNLLIPKNSAEGIRQKSICQKEGHGDFRNSTTNQHQIGNVRLDGAVAYETAVSYGQKLYSNLNPNAAEFVPSFKQQNTQVIKRLGLRNEIDILKDENKESEQDIIEEEPCEIVKQLVKDFKETSLTNAASIAELAKEHTESEATEEEKKNEELVGCGSSSSVKTSSCETAEWFSPASESENASIEPKEPKSSAKTLATNKNASNESRNEQISSSEYSEAQNDHENTKDCIEKRIEINRDKPQDGKVEATTKWNAKKTNIENGNKNKSKEICGKANASKNQSKIYNNVRHLNTNTTKLASALQPPPPSKTTTAITGTVKKVNFAKISKPMELKKDGRPVNLSNSDKISRSCASTQTSTNSKYSTQRTELTTNIPKQAVATTSSEMSTSSNRSRPLDDKLRCTKKPTVQPKAPRPTLSSKLRKAETQKRQNLFFDIDSIKMSEFLFK